MTIHILGISAFFHDSAAALVTDGIIVAAAQEERFSRRKHDPGYPYHAIEYCLTEAGIAPGDLDYVVFYERPFVKFERLGETYLAMAPKGFRPFRAALPQWGSLKLHLGHTIRERLGKRFAGKVCFTGHHMSHAASAFYPSPFREAAILTLDAVGEWSTSSIGLGRDHRIELLREMRFPHSIGMLYSAFTYYTGFKVNSGEYKLMGLAPYGSPSYADLILEKVVSVQPDGSVWLDMSYFDYCHGETITSEAFHRLFEGPPRPPESAITQKEMDLAASIQVVTEEIVLQAACHAKQLTGAENLVMAGGVALNCVANGRLLREGPFAGLWVQPAAGDAGGALGAALHVWHSVLNQPREVRETDSQFGSLLGPSYDNDDVRTYLDSVGAEYRASTSERALLDEVVGLLEQEKVIGWFQGRMEYGPRALGSRSIIGDARSPRMQQKMNLKIKFRESFRPFAPSVLREHASSIFELKPGVESPYMLLVAPIRKALRLSLGDEDRLKLSDADLRVRVSVPRSDLPAITHVDYSARIQTVDHERHGRFARLLSAFYKRTGCPVIVNTSFNIRGEPIVCNPEDAYRCFMATDMDCLVLGNLLLYKSEQPALLSEDRAEYMAQYELD